MSYKKAIFDLTHGALDELAKIDDEAKALEADAGKYSAAHYRELKSAITDKRDNLISSTKASAENLFTEHTARIHNEFIPKFEELTDDAKLLRSGIKFSNGELGELLTKYAGNRTMERVIWDYAEDSGVKPNASRITEASKIESARTLYTYCLNAMQRPQYADIWRNPEYLAQLGEGVE